MGKGRIVQRSNEWLELSTLLQPWRCALEKVRPLLASHGGNVTLLGVEDGRVRLQLEGSCHGCPSSVATHWT